MKTRCNDIVPCAATPCENGGQCELLATNAYGCVCPADFTGIRCETYILSKIIVLKIEIFLIDDCCLATHPCVTMPDSLCLNGGTCIVNDADYLCKCAPGWNGRNCQTQAGMYLFVIVYMERSITKCSTFVFFYSNKFM